MSNAVGTIVATCGYNGGWTSYGQVQVYAGYSNSTKYAACINVLTPAFSGKSKSIVFTLRGNTFRPSGGDPVLRWALCSSDANKQSYVNPGAVTSDQYQIATGTITFTDENKDTGLTIETDSLKGETNYYLMLWGLQTSTVGRITLDTPSNLSASVEYSSASYAIGDGTSFVMHDLYIANGTSYDQYVAYVGDGTNWIQL